MKLWLSCVDAYQSFSTSLSWAMIELIILIDTINQNELLRNDELIGTDH